MNMFNREKRTGVIRDNLYNNKESIYSENDADAILNYKVDYDYVNDNSSYLNDNSSIDNDVVKGSDLGPRPVFGTVQDREPGSKLVACELCNLESHKEKSNYIILSCCHTIFHIKCLIDKLNLYKISDDMKNFNLNDSESITSKNSNKSTNLVFNENIITQEYFKNLTCTHCSKNLHYEDIFSLHSKNALCNKKYQNEYNTQINSLKDQKIKIENEIKCLNEYITKLENEKKISKIMMSKTYTLMTE